MFTLLLFIAFALANGSEDKPLVKTPLGYVRGYTQPSHGGRIFSVFEGIPYAKPPIEERRFKEPEAVEPWTGTWDAIYVTQCLQVGLFQPNVTQGEEDCLYLNVYVPRKNPDPSERLDVIVHIHGGAFMLGSGHSYAHPEYFMDRDVIFVTFNYRLGVFGFLSTEDDVVPGNNGLKDQVLALKWVKDNIASFGGNPDSVTLTGLSAGGVSVHYHYLSDMSRGLFHRGFSQSGVALNPWGLQEGALTKAKLLANALGCPSDYSQVLIKCLKQRNSHQIMSKMSLFTGYAITPFSPFAPVVEKGSNPFLNKSPFEVLSKGLGQDLPWIVSNTADEGMFPAVFFQKELDEIDEKWDKIAPFLLDFNYTLPRSEWKDVSKKIRQFYLHDEKISNDNFQKLVKMFGDRLFLVDSELAIRLQAKFNQQPVYYYYFSYAGDHSQNNVVSHGDDGQYFFYNMYQRKDISDNEIKMKDIMIDMITSFAKNGKPAVGRIDWKPATYDQLTYLHIKNCSLDHLQMEAVEEIAPTNFWKSLGFQENEDLISVKDEL